MSSPPSLESLIRGTHAVIDLDRYVANLAALREDAGAGRELMVILKANAYGHGAVECALVAAEAGVQRLGVARIDEALQLRQAGVDLPVLIIGPPNVSQIRTALEHSIALTVATEEAVDALLRAVRESRQRATVHLKVDTGLHRYGAMPELSLALAERLAEAEHVDFEGLYTHFSSSDEAELEPTTRQVARFSDVLQALRQRRLAPPLIHLANSAAIAQGVLGEANVVRAGIACYGLNPSEDVPLDDRFRPILSVYSVITRRFTLAAGESVSYNRTYVATHDEPAATVPIGYADGIERHLSNRGWFVHRGRKAPIIGRVCMDQTVVRVPYDAAEGDPVTVLGDASEGSMTADEIGRICDTNNYETVVGLTARVPRIYLRAGQPYSWSIPILSARGTFQAQTPR
jgi:alanine racemase